MANRTTEAQKAAIFDALHQEGRPIYEMTQTTTLSVPEDYDSDALRKMSKRTLNRSIESTLAVFRRFSRPALK